MLEFPIVAYVQFVTKVKVQPSLYWPIAGLKGSRRMRLPDFKTFGT